MGPGFNGLWVVAFESGLAGEMGGLIERFGGQVRRGAAPREVAEPDGADVRTWAADLAAGRIDVVLFTSDRQAGDLLEAAVGLGLEPELRIGLRRTLIGSQGPACSAALRALGLGVDFEPDGGGRPIWWAGWPGRRRRCCAASGLRPRPGWT